MTYILVLILIFFALPYIGRMLLRLLQWWMARKMARMQQNAFEEMFGQFAAGQARRSTEPEPSDAAGERRHTHRQRRRGKRIDPSVGEYIEYEEIEGAAYSRESAPAADNFTAENQIDDAEWEEIR